MRKLTPVKVKQVRLQDKFWTPRRETNRKVTLETQYGHLKKTGAIKCYQWDWWDMKNGKPPWRIWMGDVGKWVEACAYTLAAGPDSRVQKRVTEAVAQIAKGQKPDGYFYANPIPKKWRWANLFFFHELYDLGHMIEGAVALHQATGDRKLLDVVCRAADLVEKNFGWEKGKCRGYDGHEEIEPALVRLYRETGESRYLKLAKFFVDVRGTQPSYFVQEIKQYEKIGMNPQKLNHDQLEYFQGHQPIREQADAVGHAVRAMYFYAGAADVAAETGDRELFAACKRLWRSATRRRMYIHGGIGSTPHGEKFTYDYDLPNEMGYSETCASIALVFFAHRMLQIEADGEYADVMERALYNCILAGVSRDGKRFFYSNRLTVYPRVLQKEEEHRRPTRQGWFGCACCPPNIARIIASLGQYMYSTSANGVYVHLYAAGSLDCEIGGRKVRLAQQTEYPWKENIRITVDTETPFRFGLALRIPAWARTFTLAVNGKTMKLSPKKGYIQVVREWKKGDRVDLVLPMPVERIEAHPSVQQDSGALALQRGPVVYCLEEIDNGSELADIRLPKSGKLAVSFDTKLKAPVITGNAFRRGLAGWNDALYRSASSRLRRIRFKAVPYCLWNNRGEGEMRVWFHS